MFYSKPIQGCLQLPPVRPLAWRSPRHVQTRGSLFLRMLQAIRCFLSRSRLFTAGARVLPSRISIREDDIPQGTHNNLVENDIGKAAVSRNRWLFVAYRQAGWRSAVVYSVLNSARRKGLNPQDLRERYPDTAVAVIKITETQSNVPGRWRLAATRWLQLYPQPTP